MMLLTTEEVIAASVGYCGKGGEGWSYNPIPFENVAKAQLKKVVEWAMEICNEHEHGEAVVSRRRCWPCWQALLKEVE